MISLIIAAFAATAVPMTVSGPRGSLSGTLVDAGKAAPVVLIIPGSGPTDRDGNNPMGVTAAPYRLLAEALATKGVSTLRADKRGMFGSKAAIADPDAVTLADYATDAHTWADAFRKRTGTRCVWFLGHSEGALIALAAAQHPQAICGLILVAAPGRKLGAVLREQLHANRANAPLLPQALAAIDSLEIGRPVDVAGMPAPLLALFRPQVQPFLIDLLKQDPQALVALTTVPVLIVQGGKDLQVSAADADALHAARPDSQLLVVPKMNHVLKDVEGDDRASNLAAYADPNLPVDPILVDEIARFVRP
ncbi:MAG: alpha/beta fold hydrolase [Sphingomicrobium sp.]